MVIAGSNRVSCPLLLEVIKYYDVEANCMDSHMPTDGSLSTLPPLPGGTRQIGLVFRHPQQRGRMYQRRENAAAMAEFRISATDTEIP